MNHEHNLPQARKIIMRRTKIWKFQQWSRKLICTRAVFVHKGLNLSNCIKVRGQENQVDTTWLNHGFN